MAPMLTAEKLKLKKDLSWVLRKQLSTSQRTVLQKLGIYCHGSKTVNLDLDGLEDSILWQLRRELRELVGSNGDGEVGVDLGGVVKEDDVDAGGKKALRVAMLKSQFAETISKANGGKPDDRERAKIKKAEIRKKEREEDELKRRRQENINKERQAARMALELVEKSVEVEDNFKAMKDFELLINGCAC